MNIIERIKSPTPKFFKSLRSIGLALLAISVTIIAAPIVLPATIVSVAGYMAVAGGVISAVSQITIEGDETDVEEPADKKDAVEEDHANNIRDGE